MLEDLYERKHCNSLLVPKADEDVRWVQEKQPNRRRRTTTVDSGLIYSPFHANNLAISGISDHQADCFQT